MCFDRDERVQVSATSSGSRSREQPWAEAGELQAGGF
jgi:hypothetical protein